MRIQREIELAPHASTLTESLRDMGYSLQTALADIVDNSITAGAQHIELLADTHEDAPAIGVLDNGSGMTREQLEEAMRPGSRNPLDKRDADDLGRFGLGLKTASFSQCRRLTVLTKRNGVTSCASWDLDTVAKRNKWIVEFLDADDITQSHWADRLDRDGTLVVWEKLDRLLGTHNEEDRKGLVRQLNDATTHLEFVFHRFLSGSGGKRVNMLLNGSELKPFDPFNSNHSATQHHTEEQISLTGGLIRIRPITLPHREKVSQADWDRYAGPEGYVSNQGFYLYRNRRLIQHGTWFRLARQLELTKLARVGIDIPNTLDADWKIDVRKASAQPPASVRKRLKDIIDKMVEPSRRTFKKRGARLSSHDRLPVWQRVQDKNQFSYRINQDHPLVESFCEHLGKDMKQEFGRILNVFSTSLPLEAIYVDYCAEPNTNQVSKFSTDDLKCVVESVCKILLLRGLSTDDVKEQMKTAEPFKSNWDRTLSVIDQIDDM